MADKTQGDLLRDYMAAAEATEAERSLRAASLQGVAKVMAGELAERVGVDKEKVKAWLNDEKPMGPVHIDDTATKLGLDAAQKLALENAAEKVKTERDTNVQMAATGPDEETKSFERPEIKDPAPAQGASPAEQEMELKKTAADAFRALLSATPKSAAEAKKSRNAAGKTGVQTVVPTELEVRLKKEPKPLRLKAGGIKARMGSNVHPPKLRTTQEEAYAIVDVLKKSLPKGDEEAKARFEAASDEFIDAVRDAQPAWDATEQRLGASARPTRRGRGR